MGYKADVVAEISIHSNDDRSQGTNDEAKLRKVSYLLTRMQCSKAHKYLQSNGLGNHIEEASVEQMMQKHPALK